MNRLLRLLVFFAPALMAMLSVFSASAQSTIDPGRAATGHPVINGDSTHHNDIARLHYTYAGTGTINNSNSERSYILSNALKLSLVKKSAEANFSNSWVYGKSNDVLTNNDFSSTLDMGLYKTIKHFYYWGLATYNNSVPLLINNQFQTGGGPGYNLIDKKKAQLGITDGVLFELNDLYDSLYGVPGGNVFRRDRYQTWRNSFHLYFHWVIGDHYTVDGGGFLQNSFINWNDYILRLTGSASIKLYKWINFTAAAAYSKFTRTRGQNTLVTFGVTIQR